MEKNKNENEASKLIWDKTEKNEGMIHGCIPLPEKTMKLNKRNCT